jgi:oligo-1,6-glucosidase
VCNVLHSTHLSESQANFSEYDIVTVGETPWTHDPAELARYVVPSTHELNMVFTFHHMDIDGAFDQPLIPRQWNLPELKAVINKWQIHMHDYDGWNSVFLENHDQARSVTRFGNDSERWRALSAKMLAIFHISQGGTIYIYQGQEIAMANIPITWGIEEYKDVATQQYWTR